MAEQEVKKEAEESKEKEDSKETLEEKTAEKAAGKSEECSDENADHTEADTQESEAADSAQEAEQDDEDLKKDEKSGKFFKKKKDKKDEKIEELNDKYTRLFAEFDNFRKRSEKEKSAMFEVGAKTIIEKVLPVVDNFERGLATVPEEKKGTGFADGMDKVYKQLMTALEEAGVKPIEAVGKEFDPNFHNAVMHVEDEEAGDNVIVEEFQKGYIYRDTVVRHSMVKVAN